MYEASCTISTSCSRPNSTAALEQAVGHHGAGRVVRVVQVEEPRAAPPRRRRSRRGPARSRARARSGISTASAPDEERPARVDRVAGVRRQRDAVGVEEGEVQVEHALLRAERRDDLGLGVERDAEAALVEARVRLAQLRSAAVRRVLVRAGVGRRGASASITTRGVGVSGSPMPRLITSTPAAFFSLIFRSSSANRYGGSRSSRLLGCIQLLQEFLAQRSGVHGPRPAGHLDLQVLGHVDHELAAVEHAL